MTEKEGGGKERRPESRYHAAVAELGQLQLAINMQSRVKRAASCPLWGEGEEWRCQTGPRLGSDATVCRNPGLGLSSAATATASTDPSVAERAPPLVSAWGHPYLSQPAPGKAERGQAGAGGGN